MGNPSGPVREVFLVHKSGCLLAYRVHESSKAADYDLVVGMLTALQSFVHEAFGAGMQSLRSVEFEDRNVVIEVREGFYMAVILDGRPTLLCKNKICMLMDKLATKYGKLATSWRGDIADWVPAGNMLDILMKDEPAEQVEGLCPLCGTIPVTEGNTCQICGYREGE